MTVNLYSRCVGDPPPLMPQEIHSVFATQDEALTQAAHDLVQGNRMYMPQRIEDENGNELVSNADIQKAGEKLAASLAA